MRNYLLLGNCQVDPLDHLLNTSSDFQQNYKRISFPLIHELGVEAALDVAPLKNADLIITQQLFNERYSLYKTEHVLKFCIEHNIKLYILTNPFFEGYYPFVFHFHGLNMLEHKMPISQDGIFLYSFINSLSIEEACNFWEQIAISHESDKYIQKINDNSLRIYMQREQTIATTSPLLLFFVTNFRHYKLMHSLNHPTNKFLYEIASHILSYINISTNTLSNQFSYELLGMVAYPIMESVTRALNLTLTRSEKIFTVFCKQHHLCSYAEILYSLYKKIPQQASYNYTLNKEKMDMLSALHKILLQ